MRVRPRIKPSQTRRVSMTTLWRAVAKPFPPKCLDKEGPAHRVGEGPKPPQPSKHQFLSPTRQTKQRTCTTPSALLCLPNWTLMANKMQCCSARQTKSMYPLTRSVRDSHQPRQEWRSPLKHSPGACVTYDSRSEPISLLRYKLSKTSKAAKIPMDPVRAINRQLTAKAA